MKDLERLDNISLHYFFGYIVMASKDAELLWKDFFRDPSEFWDDRNKKVMENISTKSLIDLLLYNSEP